MSHSTDNKRLAKNTLLLYLRMFVMMGISLFTSRVILKTLGVSDYGVYNVVAGAIMMIGFIMSSFASASSRFITISIGKGNSDEMKTTFGGILAIQCLLEVDASDADMVRVLEQFWHLSEADAKGYLAQEKSNAAIRALSHYLKAEMAWPNAEIDDFLAVHHVRDQLEDNPKLWKYEKNPAKLYKMLQG